MPATSLMAADTATPPSVGSASPARHVRPRSHFLDRRATAAQCRGEAQSVTNFATACGGRRTKGGAVEFAPSCKHRRGAQPRLRQRRQYRISCPGHRSRATVSDFSLSFGFAQRLVYAAHLLAQRRSIARDAAAPCEPEPISPRNSASKFSSARRRASSNHRARSCRQSDRSKPARRKACRSWIRRARRSRDRHLSMEVLLSWSADERRGEARANRRRSNFMPRSQCRLSCM